jgi:L-alanine-DL-glutamate epimerase-like enolase superfamily enzyme
MRIAAVRTQLVTIPLSAPYVVSRGTVRAFSNVVVTIETDAGMVGHGEAVPLSVSGDARRLASVIDGSLAPLLLDRDPGPVEAIIDSLAAASGADVAAISAVDLALWDILGKTARMPVYALFGGPYQDRISVDFTLGVDDPSAMATKAAEVARLGFGGVVVKAACRSVDEDVARVAAVRLALPAEASVRVDCNGGYGRDEALALLRRLRDFDIEFVEQPVAAADIEGMARCRGAGIPIAADESLTTPADALALVKAGACDVMNVKVSKCGGLVQARRIAAIAAAAGLSLIVGGGLAFGISRFASRHLAASCTAARGRRHQGPGPASQALIDDITIPAPSWPIDGTIGLPEGPGLGFALDAERVGRYAT